MKVPVCRRPEYTIFYELFDGLNFVHCDVFRWSKSVARQMRFDMNTLQKLLGSDVYAVNEPHGCEKHQRFMKLMGFKYHGKLAASAGGFLYVFKR